MKGEIACVADALTGRVIKIKIGPGLFNDLPYFGDTYPYSDIVTNPIGDAVGNLYGKSVAEIQYLMLNPYQAPVLSSPRNNAGGTYAQDWLREIGQSISGPITAQVNLTNPANLFGATPLNVNSSGVFTNDGAFANGPMVLNLAAPLNPTLTSEVNIRITATHIRGTSNQVITRILHYPKVIWGISPNPTLAPGDWNALTLRKTVITNNYERDYDFGTAGYAWIALPSMLGVPTLIFTDVTDPNAPAGYGITDMGAQTINNGVGTYGYQTFRSTFLITTASILRIRKA